MGSVTQVFRGDNGALVVNASGVDDLSGIPAALEAGPQDDNSRRVLAAMASWVNSTKPPASRRVNGIFDRDRYVNPQTTFDKIRVARGALRDDIVGGAADTTEALALNANYIYADDITQQDIWNQVAADLNLDARIREAWRILFTDSQLVCATWWGQKAYKARSKGAKKTWNLTVPLHMSYLDATKVAPVGSLMFGQERLAFIATAEEAGFIDGVLAARDGVALPRRAGTTYNRAVYTNTGRSMLRTTQQESGLAMVDPIISRLITSRYDPPGFERTELIADGIDPNHLYLFDPRFVFRHTLTRPQYQRFADVRLESTFEVLDLKQQLRQMERAHLIGGANYIVLVTKGSDQQAATQPEIDNLKAHVHTLGQLPVMVGDHRLDVKIVTPKQDFTLDNKRHGTLNTQLTARVYGTFSASGQDADDPTKLARIIAANLEGRRRMVRRSFEHYIFAPIVAANDDLTSKPKLKFRPETISLAFDPNRAAFLLDMREAREMSRETLHNEMGMDQAEEAGSIEREAELYDETFGTFVPHGANPERTPQEDGRQPNETQQAYQRRAGRRQGGRRGGGGAAPGTQQGKESVDIRRSETGPRRAAAAFAGVVELPSDVTTDDLLEVVATLQRPDLITVAGFWNVPYRHRAKAHELRAKLADLITEDDDDDDD